MTKEQYLKERVIGNTRTQIMKSIGASTTAFYRKLKEWGIKEVDAEDRELELLAPAKPKAEPPAEEKSPPVQEQEVVDLQAAVTLWKKDAESKAEYIADLKAELSKVREELERVNKRFMAVSGEQTDEITRLKAALSGAAVISDQLESASRSWRKKSPG